MKSLLITFVFTFLATSIAVGETKPAENKILTYLNEITLGMVKSGIMSRDSGKKIDLPFVKNCVKEQTETYLQFDCDDLLWPHHAVLLEGAFIYLLEDGASVENRALFKVTNGKLIQKTDNLPNLLTPQKVTSLLNNRFPNLKMTESRLKKIAHSHYRTRLPKGSEQSFLIFPGELGKENEKLHMVPICKAIWNGQKFELVLLSQLD